jgi:outer membrane biosynthesis protein TonB
MGPSENRSHDLVTAKRASRTSDRMSFLGPTSSRLEGSDRWRRDALVWWGGVDRRKSQRPALRAFSPYGTLSTSMSIGGSRLTDVHRREHGQECWSRITLGGPAFFKSTCGKRPACSSERQPFGFDFTSVSGMNETSSNGPTPPGWYRDAQGAMRWWDGQGWTEQVQNGSAPGPAESQQVSGPATIPAQLGATQPQPPVTKAPASDRPWFKKKRWWAVGAFVVLISVAASGGSEETKDQVATPELTSSPKPTPEAEPKATEKTKKTAPEPKTAKEPDSDKAKTAEPEKKEPKKTVEKAVEKLAESMGQLNAVSSAESYLDYSAFSRSGLIEQLEFEGYSKTDATYAVDKVDPDWNEQAAASAKNYLELSSFSRSSLIEQLEFEGFSPSQAAYGADAVGY